MKRKEVHGKSQRAKCTEPAIKKSTVKAKPKAKQAKKEDPSYFVLVGDSYYVASSKTERRNYEQFEQKVKVASSSLKKSRTRPQNNFNDNINLQDYVKTLSKEEKANLLRDLAKEVEPEQVEEPPVVEEDKMGRLAEKLQSIKVQLVARWDDQIGKINHSFENEHIGLEEKNEKISLIQKIKNNKITMINYTKLLFEKILKEEPDIELEKSERMEHIINSLNSISSIDPREAIHQLDPHPAQPKHFEEEGSSRSHGEPIKIEECQKTDCVIMSHQNLKLDIRLDEVQFGKDNYDEEIIFTKPAVEPINQIKAKEPLPVKTEVLKLQFVGERRDAPTVKEPISEQPINDEFLCVGEQRQIQIPLLMTKDRLEQLELQKSAKQIQTLGMCMKARQAFQIGELVPENIDHFTSLIDVNQFIVNLYEFIMRNFMREVIEGMNMPYGKSCIDKLYILRQDGFIPDHDHTNVLTEEFLTRYHREYSLTVRMLREEEKAHNKALFHAFNSGLNVYRPYYELEGQVFPWNTSEKGLTFYEINDENIEEVFQKSKMKVLQYCSGLCGLLPDCVITTVDARKILSKRNEECYQRMLKTEMLEHYNEWNTKKVNFQALARINLCEEIFQCELERVCEELCGL